MISPFFPFVYSYWNYFISSPFLLMIFVCNFLNSLNVLNLKNLSYFPPSFKRNTKELRRRKRFFLLQLGFGHVPFLSHSTTIWWLNSERNLTEIHRFECCAQAHGWASAIDTTRNCGDSSILRSWLSTFGSKCSKNRQNWPHLYLLSCDQAPESVPSTWQDVGFSY